MAEVLKFERKPDGPKPAGPDNIEFLFTIDVSRTAEGGLHARMYNINTEDGRNDRERTRIHADQLDSAAFSLEDDLLLEYDDDRMGAVIAAVKIYESGFVRVRANHLLRKHKRYAWMARRIQEARRLIVGIMNSDPEVTTIASMTNKLKSSPEPEAVPDGTDPPASSG